MIVKQNWLWFGCNGWSHGWDVHLEKFFSSYIYRWFGNNVTVVPTSNKDIPYLASHGIWAPFKTIECFVFLCSGWKLHSGGMLDSSLGLFVVSAAPFVVHKVWLTSNSSISIGCKFPMMVFLGCELYHGLY